MSIASRSCAAAAVALALFHCALPAAHAGDQRDPNDWNGNDWNWNGHGDRDEQGRIKLQPLATYDAGEAGSAEIVAYDALDASACSWSTPRPRPSTFSTCAIRRDRSSLRPSTPRRSARPTAWPCATASSPSPSRAIRRPIRATSRSTQSTASCSTSVQVGALPDMLTFTPDGEYVLVANEGEPSGYGAGHVDPEGSVSIIPVPRQAQRLEAAAATAMCARFRSRSSTARKPSCARRAFASTAPARAPRRISSPNTSPSPKTRARPT